MEKILTCLAESAIIIIAVIFSVSSVIGLIALGIYVAEMMILAILNLFDK